ncbi:hypothetical protein GH714_030897 [Hevea brasiliensis]|uniref:Uncharacterized protein n=1 Tax=Hevea brasiliensis TaxID=3981 RepID=A0A6A6LGF9_HEVBR|nr:hypothetical protein GH714_030897 [Hevea brasiliensis]
MIDTILLFGEKTTAVGVEYSITRNLSELNERRNKGLNSRCEETYSLSHNCDKAPLFVTIINDEDDFIVDEAVGCGDRYESPGGVIHEQKEDENEGQMELPELPQIQESTATSSNNLKKPDSMQDCLNSFDNFYPNSCLLAPAAKDFGDFSKKNVEEEHGFLAIVDKPVCSKLESNDLLLLFEEIKKLGVHPDKHTFVVVMAACFSAEAIEEVFLHFKAMRRSEYDPINSQEGSAYLSGRRAQMMNADHLLNFHNDQNNDPIAHPQPRVPPPRQQQKIKPYNKDLFIQANNMFVVLDTGNYALELIDPDKMLRWNDII